MTTTIIFCISSLLVVNMGDTYDLETKNVYNVMCMLYPDGNPDFPNSSAYIDDFLAEYNNSDYEIFYILHDKDKYDTGEIIKPHIHLAMRRSEGGTFSLDKFKRIIRISQNNCKHIDNFNAYLQYVLHRTKKSEEDGKHKYEIGELYSNFDVLPLLTNTDNDRYKTDYEIVNDMWLFLKDNYFNFEHLFIYVGEKGYFKQYHKYLRDLESLTKHTIKKYDTRSI